MTHKCHVTTVARIKYKFCEHCPSLAPSTNTTTTTSFSYTKSASTTLLCTCTVQALRSGRASHGARLLRHREAAVLQPGGGDRAPAPPLLRASYCIAPIAQIHSGLLTGALPSLKCLRVQHSVYPTGSVPTVTPLLVSSNNIECESIIASPQPCVSRQGRVECRRRANGTSINQSVQRVVLVLLLVKIWQPVEMHTPG